MRKLRIGIAGLGLLAGAAALLVPLRHAVRLERDEANPVQHLVLEGRSLLGLKRAPWGARVEGVEAWGDESSGFFLAPTTSMTVTVRAWPSFRQSLSIAAVTAQPMGALRDVGGRDAWRKWFVALLEQQLDGPSPAWEPAQRDCAGILRFAFREAWGPHTAAWRDRVGFAGPPVARDPDLRDAGPWRSAFPTPEGWKPFAKGTYLRDYACVPLSREVADAKPGDLLFFSRGGARSQPDHAMAFVRPDADGAPVLLYHTGPEGKQEGEVRRVRLDDLLHHPDPGFRPLPENPAFLGVYRWRVLSDEPVANPEMGFETAKVAKGARPDFFASFALFAVPCSSNSQASPC